MHGLLPNKTGFLLLSCRQVFSVQIACTLQLGLSHYCLCQTFSVLKASYQRHSRRLVFSFAVRCTLKTRHRPPFYSELHHPSTYCDVPEFLEDRNGGYCLAKENWEALLDLRFQEDLCCTGPSFPLLLQVPTHLACCLSLVSWAVFAWSVAFCEFSQTLNCWWYQLDSFSVWGIVQNLQSYLAVMWARNHCHLWFRTKDDKDSLSDWQWVRTRSAIHWVEQEVFLQRFWALPPFEGRFLVGLRFCPSLHACFCFLAHLWGHPLFLQGEQILALLLPFCFYRKSRPFCPPLWSTIVPVSDWTNDVFSQSFAFLIGLLCISDEFYPGFFFMCKS